MDIYKKVKVIISESGPGPGHYRLEDDPYMQDDDWSIEVSEALINRYKKVMGDYSQLMSDLAKIENEHLKRGFK